MAIQTLDNGDTYGEFRGKLNDNFSELDSTKVTSTSVLLKTNTTPYTPSSDYHPATKLYADSLKSGNESVYDPTGVKADAFDRLNHYGTITPDVVVQDADNRFVTDTDKANWNQKEDTIGPRNTAFNKNYGTTSGTTATGDHTHTKQDIGLGNVDNTSDQNKAVSDATQTALDLKADITYVDDEIASQVYPELDFDYSAVPDYQEGRIFYDAESQSLSVYTDIEDFTLNTGQEQVTRVYNNTGATIPNGSVCKGDGSSGGFPNAALALADNITNSIVIGIATHDIPNGTYGFVTHIGGLTFSATTANIDDMLFLSDTIPGGITNVPPDIVTQLGVKLTGDKIQVTIANHKAQPVALGWLYDISTVYNLVALDPTTPLVGWDGSDSIFLNVDQVTGTLEIPVAGVYRIALTFAAEFIADGKDNRTFILELYDLTDATVLATFGFPMPDNTASITGTITAPFRVDTLHELQLRIGVQTDDVTGVTFNNINFSVESIQIK